MCPLGLLSRLFIFDEADLDPELRAQRTLNRGRLPDLVRYITTNNQSYVFSAITASVDADVQFEPSAEGAGLMGVLRIPMRARFIINDGQHRRAAIEVALREHPQLADETIAVVLFHDKGLARCQQMFADLNRWAIRPPRSLNVLYDHRDQISGIVRALVSAIPLFQVMVETERSTLSKRSKKLFTLSAIHTATDALLNAQEGASKELERIALPYWQGLISQMPEWEAVRTGRISAGDVRNEFLHSHGVVLHALGRVGATLLERQSVDWSMCLSGLREIDWRRANPMWEARATLGGRVSKSYQTVLLTTNLIKAKLNLPLTNEEQRLEDAHMRGHHAV